MVKSVNERKWERHDIFIAGVGIDERKMASYHQISWTKPSLLASGLNQLNMTRREDRNDEKAFVSTLCGSDVLFIETREEGRKQILCVGLKIQMFSE